MFGFIFKCEGTWVRSFPVCLCHHFLISRCMWAVATQKQLLNPTLSSGFPDLLLIVLLVVAQVRAQFRSCGICSGQGGTGACFLLVHQFLLPILIPPSASNTSSCNIRSSYNLAMCQVDSVSPPLQEKKLFFWRGLSFGKFGLYALDTYQQFIQIKVLNMSECISQAYVTLQISRPHLK
jgi:hypothetical protein